MLAKEVELGTDVVSPFSIMSHQQQSLDKQWPNQHFQCDLEKTF